MSNQTIFMSDKYFENVKLVTLRANIVAGLITVLGAFIASWVLASLIWEHEVDVARTQCEAIATNSSRVTKFTGTTCWIQLNDGSDGFGEAWIPSEWMTMG